MIAISASLAKLFRGGDLCANFSARDLWQHSIATATAAKLLGDELNIGIPDEAFLAGLIPKYYLFDGQGTAGGCYLWESRAAADAVYTPEWKAYITERYGAAPEILYFETPVVVDNVIGEIQAAAE